MSSLFDHSFINSLSAYSNEILAVSLFAFGYFLFKLRSSQSSSNSQEKTPAKVSTTSEISSVLKYNIFIRDELSHTPSLNPFEILHQMQLEQISPDLTTYNTLLDLTIRRSQFDNAARLFDEMKDNLSPVKPDIITYNIMLKSASLQNDLKLAKEIFEEISSVALVPNDISYNTLIDCAVRVGNLTEAFEFFELMQQKDLLPDTYTYSSLIKGLKMPENLVSDKRNLDKIFTIFNEIKKCKLVKLDEVLYNCVLEACLKFADFPKLFASFSEMLDSKIEPSAVTYGILIKAYGQQKNAKAVLDACEEMKNRGLDMNEVAFGCAVDALVKCNQLDQALRLLSEGAPSNTIIYTTILKGFTKQRDFEKASQLVIEMEKNPEIKPNLVTYNSLLECAVLTNRFEDVEKVYRKMMSNKELVPDLISHSTYIKGLCKMQRPEEAYKLFVALREKKEFELDEVLFNSLLDGLVKNKQNEKADAVYRMMREDSITPSNVTYSIIIKLLSNQLKLEEAFMTFQEMKQKGVKPGLIVYTCLIQCCIKTKKIDSVLALYKEMLANGLAMDTVFYNTLVSGLVFNYKLKEALEVVERTIDLGAKLNEQVYFNLLKNIFKKIESRNNPYYSQIELSNEELELYLLKISNYMRNRNIEIEEGLYNKITNYLCKNNIDLPQPAKQNYYKKPQQNYQKKRFFNSNLRNEKKN